MKSKHLFLCTDMDRTILPNGAQAESKNARKLFTRFAERQEVKLAYVTGRHRALAEEAIKNYCLPSPDFCITDVGTKIYRVVNGDWQVMTEWEQEIDVDWGGKKANFLRELLRGISALQLQETSKQNTHKLSYYVPLHTNKEAISALIEARFRDYTINASLVWSVDEPNGIGLLDILPRNATKLHAIKFLQHQLGYELSDVVFAGDSGNDLPVLVSEIQSVLVANASQEVIYAAQEIAERNGHMKALYCSHGNFLGLNGNYAAGVLEGVCHYRPDYQTILHSMIGDMERVK